MEKYHKEPPCLLPRPNHPHFPSLHCTRNCCVWVPCHPQPWSPREKQWTLTRSLISKGSQAGASRCAQHSALRFSPKHQDGWWERFSHNFYVSVCFMCGWRRIGDRRTLGSSGTAGTRTGLGSPPPSLPEQFAHGDTAQASVVSDWLNDLITWICCPAVTSDGAFYYLSSCCSSLPNFSQRISLSAAGWDRRPAQLCRSRRCCGSLSVSLSHTVAASMRVMKIVKGG